MVLEAVSPNKDADGFHHTISAGWSKATRSSKPVRRRVIKMIESAGVSIEGKRAVVVGRK